jgi:hypothetical protein
VSATTFSARVFTLVFGIAYAITVYLDHPLFRYYPHAAKFSLHDLTDRSLGPAMSWYGWIAMAAIPAVLVAAVVPRRLGDRLPEAVFWILPVIMLLAGWHRERSWFF